jgi:hypothetical protein
MLTVPVRTVRTGHVAGPYRTRGRSVQDTWQVRTGHVAAPGMTRVMHFGLFGRTVGPIRR